MRMLSFTGSGRDIIQVRRKTFVFLYDKFTQDNMYHILSQSVRFCRLYIKKKHFVWVFKKFTAVHLASRLMQKAPNNIVHSALQLQYRRDSCHLLRHIESCGTSTISRQLACTAYSHIKPKEDGSPRVSPVTGQWRYGDGSNPGWLSVDVLLWIL